GATGVGSGFTTGAGATGAGAGLTVSGTGFTTTTGFAVTGLVTVAGLVGVGLTTVTGFAGTGAGLTTTTGLTGVGAGLLVVAGFAETDAGLATAAGFVDGGTGLTTGADFADGAGADLALTACFAGADLLGTADTGLTGAVLSAARANIAPHDIMSATILGISFIIGSSTVPALDTSDQLSLAKSDTNQCLLDRSTGSMKETQGNSA
ncbi:MAG: hypothetical protein ACRDC9_04255, partial [Plesiomonas shigelloides]